ncbi:MAG: DUF427 domain-containing protein [Alphaproteobacteria bacterium]|nr:DUF427 domain-containing protein [Alphaproteobacteria bacterium]
MPDAGSNPAPGFARKPDHAMSFAPSGQHIVVKLGGEIIAETDRALLCEESGHGPVHYIPMTDTRADLFRPTATHTHCPFKGDASYWSITAGGKEARDAAWSYDLPFDEAVTIKGHMAFYPDRVDSIEVG